MSANDRNDGKMAPACLFHTSPNGSGVSVLYCGVLHLQNCLFPPSPKCHAHDTDTMLMHVDHDHDKVLVVVRGGDGKAH